VNTNKATYWIALGVLVLGLNSEYRHGNLVALHRVAGCADSLLWRVSARAEQTLAAARVALTGRGIPADTLVASMDAADIVREQAELLRDRVRENVRDEVLAQADIIRAQAEVRRAAMEQIKVRANSQFRFARMVNRRVTIACPKTRTRVVVGGTMDSSDISPDVEAEDTF